RLCAMLLLKAALVGLMWDCKTSILRPSLLLLWDLQASKRLGIAAANLRAALSGQLPDIARDVLWRGQLTPVTEQGLNFELQGSGNVNIHVGMRRAAKIDLAHLVCRQALVRLRHVAGVPGRRIDRVKHC